MGKRQYRKVKTGKAKDYERNAELIEYYFITVNNKDYSLSLNGWDRLEVKGSNDGQYVEIEDEIYYLDWD